jgi:DNA-binding MarR family transcriptional regulator
MKISESKYGQCLYFTSNALARKIERLAIQSWKKVDLSPSHAYLLMLVIESPGMQPGIISSQLQLEPSTITRLIEKLEQKKLVIRITEGKTANVYPTSKAKELFPRLRECVSDFSKRYSLIIAKDERQNLIQSMNKITDRMNA